MQICVERFRRRWKWERLGPWISLLLFASLLTVILLVSNNFKIHYLESRRQERFQTYLDEVNAIRNYKVMGMEEQFDQEAEAIKDTHQRVEFIQNQKTTKLD